MSGHSKWSTIKHKKAKEDSKRGKAFTKLIKEITVVARDGGGDPDANARLRLLMEKAKEINMPQENTMRAIKKGTGELPGAQYERYVYEGYGPYGIAVIVDVLTDNKNRSAAEMRRLFSSHGGSLGETGSVAWMFTTLGVVRVASATTTEEQLLDMLIEFTIQEIEQNDDGTISIFCDPKELYNVKRTLEKEGVVVETAQLENVSKSTLSLPDDQTEKAYSFLESLNDHDDVQNVSTTLE